MWIGIAVVVGAGIYLTWCLVKGKIFLTLGTDLRKQTRIIDRNESPVAFWVTWVTSAVALVIFLVYLARTTLGI